jgi:hypothetical protein
MPPSEETFEGVLDHDPARHRSFPWGFRYPKSGFCFGNCDPDCLVSSSAACIVGLSNESKHWPETTDTAAIYLVAGFAVLSANAIQTALQTEEQLRWGTPAWRSTVSTTATPSGCKNWCPSLFRHCQQPSRSAGFRSSTSPVSLEESQRSSMRRYRRSDDVFITLKVALGGSLIRRFSRQTVTRP